MRSLFLLLLASALSASAFADKRFMQLVPDDELTEIRLDSHTEVVIDDNKEPTTAATMDRNRLLLLSPSIPLGQIDDYV